MMSMIVKARISTGGMAALALLCTLSASPSFGANGLEDVKGGKDHPAVSRFKGSVLLAVTENPFESIIVGLGPTRFDYQLKRAAAAKETVLEGRVARYVYIAPNTTSPLEVARNYEQALSGSGFRLEYKCGPSDCGGVGHGMMYHPTIPRSQHVGQASFLSNKSFYVVARGGTSAAPLWVMVMVGVFQTNGRPGDGQALIYQIAIEPKPTSLGNVTADAKAMSGQIAAYGKATVYGLLFDTGSAALKPESKPQLVEIVNLLKSSPNLSVIVVGHTDNQGSLDLNIKLSEQRAAAVVEALTTEYGVAATRLTARGVGMVAPVASNRSEAGRAQNRRVEIVER